MGGNGLFLFFYFFYFKKDGFVGENECGVE